MPWSKPPSKSIAPNAAKHAKTLRRTLTEPEKRLWWHLRHRLPVVATHFRRQVPIETYIADFCCLSHRLIIEVDGNQHGFERQTAYDERRTAALERCGYRVLRFSNRDVMREIDGVLATIATALAVTSADTAFSGTTPTPDPSPQGGGESAEP
ncbi:endonuclease domain-containing protein [Methylobacterium brachythecii]|uniref:Very-short-patch-repair endonuclease n=1 Tax=Methylobacterium brachythecii TaxID=1176177 RepID=A0A7W6F7M3_9HYPH|nr:endonuclease domain-containing protein [Methylobacterium brachythecii]MBB3903530.1 very-short-patch-repair endonuclease [Methylobacterium brachythecii]GLS44117.1 hypothetical protein GCM10007884_21040 [Methylobacterium brachythecii]